MQANSRLSDSIKVLWGEQLSICYQDKNLWVYKNKKKPNTDNKVKVGKMTSSLSERVAGL